MNTLKQPQNHSDKIHILSRCSLLPVTGLRIETGCQALPRWVAKQVVSADNLNLTTSLRLVRTLDRKQHACKASIVDIIRKSPWGWMELSTFFLTNPFHR